MGAQRDMQLNRGLSVRPLQQHRPRLTYGQEHSTPDPPKATSACDLRASHRFSRRTHRCCTLTWQEARSYGAMPPKVANDAQAAAGSAAASNSSSSSSSGNISIGSGGDVVDVPSPSSSHTSPSLVSGIEQVPPPPPRVVVAVDFGTWGSAYACARVFDPTVEPNPKSRINCEDFAGAQEGKKTRTAVLLDAASHAVVAFGNDAIQRYLEATDEQRAEWLFFDKFKMALYQKQIEQAEGIDKYILPVNPDTVIPSADGHRDATAKEVIGASLQCIRDHALQQLKVHDGGIGVKQEEVKWVITVPAIWTEKAKDIMYAAAAYAGMTNVATALEPEAASRLARHEFEMSTGVALPIGTVYMVLDCGGGTVDVTVHKTETLSHLPGMGAAAAGAANAGGTVQPPPSPDPFLSPGAVSEVYKASGGYWGSTLINDEFVKLLNDIFEPRCFEPDASPKDHTMFQFRTKNPSDWQEMMDEFENRKCHCPVIARRGATARVKIPSSLQSIVSKEHGHSAAALFASYYDEARRESLLSKMRALGLSTEDEPLRYDAKQMLVMSQSYLQSLMLPVIERTLAHAEQVLRDSRARDVSHIFIVGGFAQCPLLFERARQRLSRAPLPPSDPEPIAASVSRAAPSSSASSAAAASGGGGGGGVGAAASPPPFPSRVVVRPSNPDLCVLKGAVLYGLSSHITQRVSQWTWGVQCNDVWDDVKYAAHLDRRIELADGRARCKNVLSAFVRADDSVVVGEPRTRVFIPSDLGCLMEVKIFCSDERECRFTDVDSCTEVGTLSIQLPPANATNSNDRSVTVAMFFGEEKLRVVLQVNATKEVKRKEITWTRNEQPRAEAEQSPAHRNAKGTANGSSSSSSSGAAAASAAGSFGQAASARAAGSGAATASGSGAAGSGQAAASSSRAAGSGVSR